MTSNNPYNDPEKIYNYYPSTRPLANIGKHVSQLEQSMKHANTQQQDDRASRTSHYEKEFERRQQEYASNQVPRQSQTQPQSVLPPKDPRQSQTQRPTRCGKQQWCGKQQ
jgi:hypothetical protein